MPDPNYQVCGSANCGCVGHAEDQIPCIHDLQKINHVVEGDWYAPQQFLQQLYGVEKVEILDTTSSAGDWSGYFLVTNEDETKPQLSLIPFSQENNFPKAGYTLHSGEIYDTFSPEQEEDVVAEFVAFRYQ